MVGFVVSSGMSVVRTGLLGRFVGTEEDRRLLMMDDSIFVS